jgi:hypothetical protein
MPNRYGASDNLRDGKVRFLAISSSQARPNATPLASITAERMGLCVVVLRSTTKEVFEAYVEQALSPRLGPGKS